jgi:hypothetical protein
MSLKLELIGLVNNIGPKEQTKNGFKQQVIITIPEYKDEFGDVKRKEQFFRIEIWSNSQTDSRFLDIRNMKEKKKALLYLNGERWLPTNSQEFAYNNKLKLIEWQKA